MKLLIKASLITTLLVLSSCAHHRGHMSCCCKSQEQCKMKDEKCKMKDGEQCPIKSETKEAAPEAKK